MRSSRFPSRARIPQGRWPWPLWRRSPSAAASNSRGTPVDALKEEYDLLGAFKNGPRLWTLDWVEVMVGGERDFAGLKARWVMWLDVPKEMRKHESVAYKPISGKRDTQLGINKGSPAFLLDDPDGDTWCMKSASLIVDPTRPTRA
jgi:hypothetical protein